MKGDQVVVGRHLQVAVLRLFQFYRRADHCYGVCPLVGAVVTIVGYMFAQSGDVACLRVGLDALEEPLGGLHREVCVVFLVSSDE